MSYAELKICSIDPNSNEVIFVSEDGDKFSTSYKKWLRDGENGTLSVQFVFDPEQVLRKKTWVERVREADLVEDANSEYGKMLLKLRDDLMDLASTPTDKLK